MHTLLCSPDPLLAAGSAPDILLTSLFPVSLFRVLSLPGAAGRVTLGIPAGLLSPYTRTKSLSDMGIPSNRLLVFPSHITLEFWVSPGKGIHPGDT